VISCSNSGLQHARADDYEAGTGKIRQDPWDDSESQASVNVVWTRGKIREARSENRKYG
jgi:ABC-type branched-subunit amino acid transport system substrate-binding protein